MGRREKRRTEFRKRHQGRVRDHDLTRRFRSGDDDRLADAVQGERLSGKGELTRRRTVQDAPPPDEALRSGTVLSVHGLQSRVMDEDGRIVRCAVRQVLKDVHIEDRVAVVAGDRVRFRCDDDDTGWIWEVMPRRGVVSRTSRGRRHVLASNIDQLMIIASVAQPSLKPALVDRFLLTAAQCDVQPLIVMNKIDLIDPAELAVTVGTYASMGYPVLLTSATSGQNIDQLSERLRNRSTALAGQSGVGKSSLLNAVQPGLGLAVGEVSQENEKGRHTTTASQMIPLDFGGAVFDTPGIRQFQLWDIAAEEVAGLMPDLRPFVSLCRYPDCLHLHEDDCAVKDAVADGLVSDRRYDAYCHLLENDLMVAG